MHVQTQQETKPFNGRLTPVNAANAIRSARLNARDLVETAELLFSLKRFPHAMAMSILAIEEAAKVGQLLMIFLEIGGETGKVWKSYRSHRAKTSWLNSAIESRVRATFPNIPREAAKQVGAAGPTPEFLETSKQRAIYSDCIDVNGDFVAHCPNLAEWRQDAWERLCEAQAVMGALRDYPPAELQVWQEHVSRAIQAGKNPVSALPDLHADLMEKGFVEEGWWDTLLRDAQAEMAATEHSGSEI